MQDNELHQAILYHSLCSVYVARIVGFGSIDVGTEHDNAKDKQGDDDDGAHLIQSSQKSSRHRRNDCMANQDESGQSESMPMLMHKAWILHSPSCRYYRSAGCLSEDSLKNLIMIITLAGAGSH